MYLLSVIIPTKDRYEYLEGCLKSLVALNSDELEIVVQDNTQENSQILAYINNLNWKHIKYYHDSSPLSQTGNSDLALAHATGEYCTYIGDDDSLSYLAIEAARYLKNHNIPACVNNVATYHWPDVVYAGKEQPVLTFDSRNVKIKKINSQKVLNNFLSWGCQDIKFLPRVYHGIIKHDVLMEIYERTGSYFPGPSPDMANAVASLLLIDKYIYIRCPLIISGYSFKSAGGMGLRGAHSGSLKTAKQLPPNAEKEWSPRIPKVWLGYTVWPESAEKAFMKMDSESYIKEINYFAMYAKIFLKYSNYRKMVLSELKNPSSFLKLFFESSRFMVRWLSNRAKLLLRTKNGNQYVSYDAMSLEEACSVVDSKYINVRF